MFQLLFTPEAVNDLNALEKNNSQKKRLKAVNKALTYLQKNPKHPSLKTHKYSSFANYYDEPVFEAYAENNTPAAFRIFWHYGPHKNEITIITIIAHP